jgi:hypothetical protein
MTLGEYLKQNGIRLTDFARLLGDANIPTVHDWISGRRLPKLLNLVAIERATGGAVRAIDFMPPEVPAAPPAVSPPLANDAVKFGKRAAKTQAAAPTPRTRSQSRAA